MMGAEGASWWWIALGVLGLVARGQPASADDECTLQAERSGAVTATGSTTAEPSGSQPASPRSAPAAEKAQPGSVTAGSMKLAVASTSRVAVHLANPPASRLRVSFDTDGGEHRELEWDPAVSADLTRAVELTGAAAARKTTEWRVTVAMEQTSFTQSQGTVLLTVRFDRATCSGATGTLVGTYVALLASPNVLYSRCDQQKDKSASCGPGLAGVDLAGWPAPTLTFNVTEATKPAIGSLAFSSGAAAGAPGGLRGFGAAPAIVTDTLSILTEIAVERAKAGAMRVLAKRLIEPLCGDPTKEPGKQDGVTLGALFARANAASNGNGSPTSSNTNTPAVDHGIEPLAFPRTCELVTTLRLEDLLASGKALLLALRDDLRFTLLGEAMRRLDQEAKLPVGVGTALLAFANAAIDHGGADELAVHALIESLGRDWLQVAVSALGNPKSRQALAAAHSVNSCDKNCLNDVRRSLEAATTGLAAVSLEAKDAVAVLLDYGCTARLAVAVLERCSAGGCTPSAIADYLQRPQAHFSVEKELPASLCWSKADDTDTYRQAPEALAPARQLVLDGLRLVAPVAESKGAERAKAALRLAAELLRLAGGLEESTLQPAVEFAIALVDEDYGSALARLSGLLRAHFANDKRVALRKLSSFLGAVASYAEVYRATKDSDPAAARKARKAALESLIDSATDRAERGGDRVVSLGSNVGLAMTWSSLYQRNDDALRQPTPGLRVPLGLSVQWLPQPRANYGLYLSAQLADLGQFVRRGDGADAMEDLTWADFVAPGLEAGLPLGFLDPAINLGLHLSYAPTLGLTTPGGDGVERRSAGVWRFGVHLSYYVPFFDFN